MANRAKLAGGASSTTNGKLSTSAIPVGRPFTKQAARIHKENAYGDFLGLPTEIRLMIVELAISDHLVSAGCSTARKDRNGAPYYGGGDPILNTKTGLSQPSITRVCRQLRAESLPLFYAAPRQFITTDRHTAGTQSFVKWVCSTKPEYRKYMKKVALVSMAAVHDVPMLVSLDLEIDHFPAARATMRMTILFDFDTPELFMPALHCGYDETVAYTDITAVSRPVSLQSHESLDYEERNVLSMAVRHERQLDMFEQAAPSPLFRARWSRYVGQEKEKANPSRPKRVAQLRPANSKVASRRRRRRL